MNNKKDFEFTIESGKSERHYWMDLWRYRELFYILAWRDIAVRYKQTIMGILWAVVRPLLTMMIFVIVFGHIAKLPSEGIPYPIFVFAAMLPWTFFTTAFADASNSLVGNSNLISKVGVMKKIEAKLSSFIIVI
jgi:lipopolysaccharide transport system permease protein